MAIHSGSCLCGNIKFEIKGEFELFFLCHCGHCRKDTGSAHAANLFSTSAKLKWISGQGNVKFFNLPFTLHSRNFCSVCGSALPCEQGNLLVVPAGSLDTDVSIKPNAHIFVSSRATWDQSLETAPVFEQYPS